MSDTIRKIEGLLFLSGNKGVTIGELISLINKDQLSIEHDIQLLIEKYEQNDNAFTILKTAQSYKLVTLNKDSDLYQQYAQLQYNDKISNSAMETLAIIAYNQPITRFEIEETRGVLVGHNIKLLMDNSLIKVSDIAENKRSKLYATTAEFLDFLGINSLEELPPLTNFVYELQNSDDHQLFEDIDDFKEIRKRLLNSQNIIMNREEYIDNIDDIEVPKLILDNNEEGDDAKITKDNSTK